MKFTPFFLISAFSILSACSPTAPTKNLPIINLGYVQQQATSYNATGHYYVFKNIRYAAPPTGDRRFEKPQKPVREYGVQDGKAYGDGECTQFVPGALKFPGVPAEGMEFGTEDCLFLDVYVPANIKKGDTLPVLGWWHGGGWSLGSKTLSSNPAGLLHAANGKIIYVAANYRLGMFGALAPPDKAITPNLGLYDVLAGMDWIAKHIGKFGGDPKRFTVMGGSAGSGQLQAVLVSAPRRKLPFQKAIVQSGTIFPQPKNQARSAATWDTVKKMMKCNDAKCVRNASYERLKKVNSQIAENYLLGIDPKLTFAPAVDGELITDVPIKLLAEGKVNKLQSIIVSNTRYEGAYFAGENITDASFEATLRKSLFTASNTTIERVLELFPNTDHGSPQGAYSRAEQFQTDWLFGCAAQALAGAYAEQNAYRYIYNIGRGWHGDDMSATYWNGNDTMIGKKDAVWHQERIVEYVRTGKVRQFTKYSEDENVANWLNDTGRGVAADPWAPGGERDERCRFFIQGKEWL